MQPATETSLALLFSRLKDWISVSDFQRVMNAYFLGNRSHQEVADYREKRGALKKLRDEVTPVLHHLQFNRTSGEIRFELGGAVPDCWLRDHHNAPPQGIEVTVAQSREGLAVQLFSK